jgi:hypothetical protein
MLQGLIWVKKPQYGVMIISKIMKGILEKTRRGWVVKQIISEGFEARLIKTFPLYKSDADQLEINVFGEHGEVEFEIIDEFTHPEYYHGVGWGDGIKMAKLK